MEGLGRRKVLGWGAGLATAACGGLLGRAWYRGAFNPGQGPAFEAWSEWEREPLKGPEALIQAAVLAASPHNTQPWKFVLAGNRIHALADLDRNLGAMDPLRRELVISLGCALENLVQAAPLAGCQVEFLERATGKVQDGPRNGLREMAVLGLQETPRSAPILARVIPRRHTHRGPYLRSKVVPGPIRDELSAIAASEELGLVLFDEGPDRQAFEALTLAATRAILEDPGMLQANAPWMRHSRRDIETRPDGVTLDNAGLSPFLLAVAKTLPPLSIATEMGYWESAMRDVALATSPSMGFLLVKDRLDVGQALKAGRVWERMHLAATGYGLALQPMNQIPEMLDRDLEMGRSPRWPDLGRLIHRLAPGMELTFAFRAGYPVRRALPSPRRPLREVLTFEPDARNRPPRT